MAQLETVDRLAARTPDTTRHAGGAGWPPGPKGHFLLGHMREINRDPLRLFVDAHRRYGDVVSLRFGPWPFVVVAHPNEVSRILHENHRNYDKNNFDYDRLKTLVGEGLLTAEGPLWLSQRRLMQPLFSRERIAAYGPLMTQAALETVENWQQPARRGQPLDIAAEMMRLTLTIIGRAMFGRALNEEADIVSRSFTVVNEGLGHYGLESFLPWLPTPRTWRMHAAIRQMDEVVMRIIDQRRNHPNGRDDLLSLLLAARDQETGKAMSDHQVRDEVITIMLAGHETTANALSWTWYLLSRNHDCEAVMRQEIARVLGDRPPTVDDLPALNYTRMVIEESMRIYPPAWAISRNVRQDDELGGFPIPAGAVVTLAPYLTHRHPEFWPDSERFDPLRFTAENNAKRPRYAYFPFGGGPRLCIGANFAMIEAQLLLVTIAQHYSLTFAGAQPVIPQPLITLRPLGGLRMVPRALSN